MLIGISGTLGSGKGTVVEYLKTKGFNHYSISGILKQILNEQGLPSVRENTSNLANELMKKYEGGVLTLAYEFAQKEGADNYILESIHRVSEAEYVKKIGGIILGVDADIAIRYERISKRQEGEKDNVTFEQFVTDSQREEDGKIGTGPNIKAVIAMADYTITNNGTVPELHKQIELFLTSIQKSTK